MQLSTHRIRTYGMARREVLVDTQAKGDTAATVAIASISDQDWYISRTHGVYHIPACPKLTAAGMGPAANPRKGSLRDQASRTRCC